MAVSLITRGLQWSSSHPENLHTAAGRMIKLLSNAWLEPDNTGPRPVFACQVQLGEGSRVGTETREEDETLI